MLNVATQAIRKAGNFIIKQYEFINRNHSHLSVDYINTLIPKIEIESKHIIATIINKFYPSHIININEKSTLHNTNSNNVYWIIESIDSYTNFIKQFPFFALSIAMQHKEHIEIGVIYDPIHNELFSACKGKGALYNGYRIRFEHNYNINKYLNKSVLSLSCLNNKNNTMLINLLHFFDKQNISIDFRRTGSIILDLVYVTLGRLDGCIIIALKKTNKLASAMLIIKESGGLIIGFNKNKTYNTKISEISGNLIIGQSKTVKKILTTIKSYTKI